MAHPFGLTVQFKEYMAWAHSQGCTFASAVQMKDGICTTITTITSPLGKSVPIAEVTASEYLPLSVIKGYDRRLGLQSRFGP